MREYQPNVNISLNGEPFKESPCFSGLRFDNEPILLKYKLLIHQNCSTYKDKWIQFVRDLTPTELCDKFFTWSFENDELQIKYAANVGYGLKLLVPTLIRYLQEFPEILVAFCEKYDTINDDNSLLAFLKLHHSVRCRFYDNLSGHGVIYSYITIPKKPYDSYIKKLTQPQYQSSLNSLFKS